MRIGDLTKKQYEVLKFIFKQIRTSGSPPSWQEICDHFNFSSSGSARRHLYALEKKGYITRSGKHRGLELVKSKVWALFGIPLVGKVPAGNPRLADAEFISSLTPDDLYPSEENLFALRIQGESMINAGILPGDIVIIREQPTADNGEIVVAQTNDEDITIKKLVERKQKFYLEPANPLYQPIELNGGKILGKVIEVIRKL